MKAALSRLCMRNQDLRRLRFDPALGALILLLAACGGWILVGLICDMPPFQTTNAMSTLVYTPLHVRLYWWFAGVQGLCALALPLSIGVAWFRSRSRMQRLLLRSTCASLVLQPESWLSASGKQCVPLWLRSTALKPGGGIIRELQFAAGHWRSLEALVRHRQRRELFQALDQGLFFSEPAIAIFIGYAPVLAFLSLFIDMALEAVLFPNFWICLAAVHGLAIVVIGVTFHWFIEARAAEAALIDFFLE